MFPDTGLRFNPQNFSLRLARGNTAAHGPSRRTVMERGAVIGLDHDLPQVGVLNLLVAHARLDSRVAAAVASAIAANTQLLAQLNPLFRGLDRLIAEHTEGST